MHLRRLFFIGILILYGCTKHTGEESSPVFSQAPSLFQPEPSTMLERDSYTLAYDGRIRGASWVYEKLTASSLDGTADRSHFDFMEDPKIPSLLRATQKDFKGSGFDRGHLSPAADARSSPEAMRETFYLSNISPQNPHLNRNYWLKLEKYVRNLTQSYDVVYVITGPLFLPQEKNNGKRYIQYEVIGPNDVAVPTHYFKVLRAKKGNTINTQAFIIPNQPIPNDPPLKNFAVTLEKVEKAAGIIFK